jgi:hypothetical protein
MRLRSSSRCSIRLMPGSSARSETALRARSRACRNQPCRVSVSSSHSWAGTASGALAGDELGMGRPVDGGMMLRSPEVAMGTGAGSRFGRAAVRGLGRGVCEDSSAGNRVADSAAEAGGLLLAARACSSPRARTPRRCDCRGWRRGGFDGGDLLLAVGLLGDAELLLHLRAELVGGAAEIGHQLAELAREDGQLLRTEEQQCEENEDCAVLEARHTLPNDTASVGMGTNGLRWRWLGAGTVQRMRPICRPGSGFV